MATPVHIGFVLPEEYTPLELYQQKIAELEKRLEAVEGAVDPKLAARVDGLATDLRVVEADVATIKQEYVTLAEHEKLAGGVGDVTTSISTLQDQIGGFRFNTGDVAALTARGALDVNEVYVVVDTAERLAELAANDTGDRSFNIVFGAA